MNAPHAGRTESLPSRATAYYASRAGSVAGCAAGAAVPDPRMRAESP